MPENRLEIIIGTKDDQFRQGMARVRSEAASSAKSIEGIEEALKGVREASTKATQSTENLGDGLKGLEFAELTNKVQEFAEGVADAAGNALGTFTDAGDEVLEFRDRVAAAYSVVADQKVIIEAGERIQKTFRGAFSLEEVAENAQVFAKYGASATQASADLDRAAKVAKAAGKDLGTATEPLAEALRSDGSFDPGVFEEISVQLGIGGAALEKYGAKVDGAKKVIAGNTEEQLRAQKALRAYIDENERFAGVADRTSTSYGQAKAEVEAFNRAAGEQYNQVRELVAEAILPLLKFLNDLPDSFKAGAVGVTAFGAASATAIGVLSQLAGIIKLVAGPGGLLGIGTAAATAGSATAAGTSAMAAGAAEAEAAFLAAQTATTGAASAVTGLAAGLTGVGVVLVAGAAILNERNKGLIDSEQAEQALIDTLSIAAIKYKDLGKIQQQSTKDLIAEAEAIKNVGQQRAQYSKDIVAFEDAASKARAEGNEEAAKAADIAAQQLRNARAANDADLAKAKAGDEQFSDAWQKRKADDYAWLDKLAAENAKKREAEATKASADDEKNAAEEQKRQERLAALRDRDTQLQRSALALKTEALSVSDEEIAALEAKLAKGEDVSKQLEQEIAQRAKSAKAILDEEAALDRKAIKQKAEASAKTDPDNGAEIRRQAAEEERQLNEVTASKKAAIDKAAAAEQKSATEAKAQFEEAAAQKSKEIEREKADLALATFEQQSAAQQAVFDERRQQIESEIALGQNRAAELAKLDAEQAAAERAYIDERTKLQIAAIEKRRDAEKAGKTSAEQELIIQQAQLDIEKAKLDAKLATKAVVDQSLVLQQQQLQNDLQILQALKDQNSERDKAKGFDLGSTFATGPQSVADAFGGNASGLGVSRSSREGAVAPDGRTQAEVERDIARQQGILNSQATRASGSDPESSAFGVSRAARTSGGQSGQISDTPGSAPSFDISALVAEQQTTNQLLAQLAGGDKLNAGWESLLGRSRGGPNLPGLT